MAVELSEIVDRVMRLAEGYPEVEEAEGYASRNSITMARIETVKAGTKVHGPAPQQLKSLNSIGASVRVAVKGAVGSASTAFLSDQQLENTVRLAVKNAKIMKPDENFRHFAVPDNKKARKLPIDKSILNGEVFEPVANEAELAIAAIGSGLELAGSIMTVLEEFSVGNTSGIGVDYCADTFAVSQLTSEQVSGSEVLSSGMGWSASRCIKDLKTEEAVRDAEVLAQVKPEVRSVPEGEYSVILGQYAVADIIDNMLSSDLYLDSIYMGTSWLPKVPGKNAKGQELMYPEFDAEVASKDFTFTDDPHIEKGMGSKAYDCEGLSTGRTKLIEGGVLRGVLSDTYYAHLYEFDPTASGYRFGNSPGRSASASISSCGTNMVVESGDCTFDELVELSEGPTLYLPRTWYTYPTRMGATTFSSSNRSTAFIIENEEPRAVRPNAFKLTGDISKILKGIVGIGKETKLATTWAARQAAVVPEIATVGVRVERPAEGDT